jgi:hypothetical protein
VVEEAVTIQIVQELWELVVVVVVVLVLVQLAQALVELDRLVQVALLGWGIQVVVLQVVGKVQLLLPQAEVVGLAVVVRMV